MYTYTHLYLQMVSKIRPDSLLHSAVENAPCSLLCCQAHTHTHLSCHTHTHTRVCSHTVPSGLINVLRVNYACRPLHGCPGQSQRVIFPTFMNGGQQPTRGSWEAGGCWTPALQRVTGGLFGLSSILKRSDRESRSFMSKWDATFSNVTFWRTKKIVFSFKLSVFFCFVFLLTL